MALEEGFRHAHVHALRAGALVLVAALAMAPAAAARSAPVLYFLADDPAAPTPLADGILVAYDPVKPNVPNGTQPHSRPILAGQDTVYPVRFTTPVGEHPGRLQGPLFMALWLGESTTLRGNLTVTVFELPPASPALPSIPGVPLPTVPPVAPHAIASAHIVLDANLTNLPNATKLVPPTPTPPAPPDPTDPQGAAAAAAAYAQQQALAIAFYEVAQAAPILLKAPAVLNMGFVDVPVNDTSRLAVGFRLDQGSSPAPGPLGAFAQVNYDYLLGPSYLFVPWFQVDPQPTPPATHTSTASPTPTGAPHPATLTGTGTSTTHKSPGVGTAAVVGLLGALVVLARRRS